MQTEKKSLQINYLAHDVNNILSRIINSIELLKKKIINYAEVQTIINSIENSTYMISEIIDDAVSINKSQKYKKININLLLNDIVNSFLIHLKDKINFILKLESDIFLVEGKYIDYYRILTNLITNAVESIKEKGTVTITTMNFQPTNTNYEELKLFAPQTFIQIKVADTGEGIEPSLLPFIFDENFSTKRKTKNRGIGLTIVDKLIKNYNGTIKVKSEINKGTEFIVFLPAIKIKKKKNYNEKKIIMIAEDEIILQELLIELLEPHNFEVITASNGTDVINKINSIAVPDILIIDQYMPDMDGISCINKVKELYKDLPVILATGSQSSFEEYPEFNKIVNRIINKPYNIDELLLVIRELID